MSNSSTSNNTSANCSLEVCHFANLLHRVHLKFQTSLTFFISERKQKVWAVIFLVGS